ncbi:MAG: SMI1/KNR4 family protein [Bacteroidota bacterium]|nr:SMI1/KNR4 family protein [Bacteroidota bacterium]
MNRLLNKGFRLPDDLRAFYEFSNGFESGNYIFRIIPLEEAMRELIEHKNGIKGSEFVLAEYLIYSDTWKIRLKSNKEKLYDIINNNHQLYIKVSIIECVFEFIIKYLESSALFCDNGLYKWFEQRISLGY